MFESKVHFPYLRLILSLFGLFSLAIWGTNQSINAQVEPAQSGPVPPAPYFSSPTPEPLPTFPPIPTTTPRPTSTPQFVAGPVTVAFAQALPQIYALPMRTMLNQTRSISVGSWLKRPLRLVDNVDSARVQIKLEPLANIRLNGAIPLLERYYVVVAPFNTVADDIALDDLRLRWQGLKPAPLYVSEAAALDLPAVLGVRRVSVVEHASWAAIFANTPDAIGILPFDQLDPSYKVLTVNGVNPLSNRLQPTAYALAVGLTVHGAGSPQVATLLQSTVEQRTNRNANLLTTLIMTGVTAMSRTTAAKMEEKGYVYPAAIISDTLRAADITHISNEVPFLSDCQVNAAPNNLVMCSHTNYWASLEAVGTDIVGLSGNHVNDFGRSGARESIGWYRANNVPIYGSGMNVQEACAPLLWYHNGTRFAFLAALAFGPEFAWATADQPGACYYYDHKEEVLASIRQLSQQVDVVAVELQYEETYNPYPTSRQVEEFRELREAGATLVTGVQSHVPQALEPYGADDPGGSGMIVYGLGNLFFDQMQSWNTRTELYIRHTFYEGRLISTEILTGVLEDFAQPRWATTEERAGILNEIFAAAPRRPRAVANTGQ